MADRMTGEELGRARDTLGWSDDDMAEAFGVSPVTVRGWLAPNSSQVPRHVGERMRALAEARRTGEELAEMDPPPEMLAEELAEAFDALGWGAAGAARKLDVSETNVHRWLSRKRRTRIPPELARWIRTMAVVVRSLPPPPKPQRLGRPGKPPGGSIFAGPRVASSEAEPPIGTSEA